MNAKKHTKEKARAKREAKQARRVVNGIAIALVLLMFILLGGYYLLMS